MIFKVGQARGSGAGSATADFTVSGLAPGTTAYVTIVGWSFDFQTEEPRPIDEIGIWTQEAIPGGWRWANEFNVDSSGQVKGRFVGFINDDNDDDQFSFLVNYLLIGMSSASPATPIPIPGPVSGA